MKNSKSRKKRKPGRSLGILLFLLIVIAVLLFLISYRGRFGTTGTGTGESEESGILIASGGILEASDFQESGGNSETEPETESETQITILNITVMGSMYLYQNQEILLEDLLSAIQELPDLDSVIIQIQDDNATQNAMEDLLNALQESGITYALLN